MRPPLEAALSPSALGANAPSALEALGALISCAEHYNEHINYNSEWYNTSDGNQQQDYIPAEG